MKEKKETKRILVVGSIAYDIIFDLHGRIQDQIQIVKGKLQRQNLMFTAKNKKQFFGGTAGNIAYGLGLLKTKPILFSVAGKDFLEEYKNHLQRLGVEVRSYIDRKGFTAIWYGMTDMALEQVGVWQGNAYNTHIEKKALTSTISEKELRNISLAIFSAGTPKSTLRHMQELRAINKEVRMFFDPGQSLTLYTERIFIECLAHTDFFIANDVEIAYCKKLFNFDLQKTLLKGKIVIETKGENGSTIHERDSEIFISPWEPKNIVDVSGAGDAYRAGLLSGLAQGLSLFEAGSLGAKIAAKCIESLGAQEYKI